MASRLCLPLLISLLAGCSTDTHTIEIPLEARFNGQPISCERPADGVHLSDLRFYVSNLQVAGASAGLAADGFWQNAQLSLIDLEDGSGSCINGTERSNATIRATVPAKESAAHGLSFNLAVPEDLNHQNPVTAEAPLGFSEMHWHWRSGYKFFRAGVISGDDGFWIHIGSSRCSGTIGNIEGCESSNRPFIDLPDFVAGQHKIVVDLGVLFAGENLGDGQPANCSSGPAEDACRDAFGQMGLDFESGESIKQTAVFSLEPVE